MGGWKDGRGEGVFQETVKFVDVCYKLTCDDLQQTGVLPV